MTTEPNRVDAGVPTGGQFATKLKSDDVPALPITGQPGGVQSLLGMLAERDAVRERRERAEEQCAALNQQAGHYAVRGLAATLLDKHPMAATLRLTQNEEGGERYEAHQLLAADGTILEDSTESVDWTEDEAPNGTYVYEFIDDLDFKDLSWAHGFGTVIPETKYDFGKVDIDLRAAAASPVPRGDSDIATRALSEDEQETLVDTARAGIRELEDQLTERSGDYSRSELEAIQEKLNAAWQLLN